MRQRVAAIIIRNNKLLLVSAPGHSVFWTPGGGLEEGENDEATMKREIKEELCTEIETMKYLFDYEGYHRVLKQPQLGRAYLVTTKTEADCSGSEEIDRMFWVTREEIENDVCPTTKGVKNEILPKLIEHNIL